MKRKVIISLMFICLLVVTGCNNNKEKVLKCTLDQDLGGGTKYISTYEVTSKGNTVKRVETVEKIISDSQTELEMYKEQVENTYGVYGNIDHFTWNVKINGDTLTSLADINYEKIDLDEYLKINPAIKSIVKDGKVQADKIRVLYEAMGATCK